MFINYKREIYALAHFNLSKVKRQCIAVSEAPHRYGSLHVIMGSHRVTCHPTEAATPALTPAESAGTRFIHQLRMKG